MSLLISARVKRDIAKEESNRAQAEWDEHVANRWMSRSRWHQLGFELSYSKLHPIVREYDAPRGVVSYEAYHAIDVQIRLGVWRKMIRVCGVTTFLPPTLANRKKVYDLLVKQGNAELAQRLQFSLVTKIDYCRDLCRLEWLNHKRQQAFDDNWSAAAAYTTLWSPVLRRRDLNQRLKGLGATGLSSETSIEELKRRLSIAEREVDRKYWDSKLPDLGIVTKDLPDGIVPSTLAEKLWCGGYLCTVPNTTDATPRIDSLREREKAMEAWIMVNFPEQLEITTCYSNPNRSKIHLKPMKPSQTFALQMANH